MAEEPEPKRRRTSSPILELAPPGEERMAVLSELAIRHGSSLAIISRGTSLLNEYFENCDPEKDWRRYQRLGATPYFICVLEDDIIASVWRLILDGTRVVVDYALTRPELRGRGVAGRVVNIIKAFAQSRNFNLYISALEDSCTYWMNHGFILETGDITKRLNASFNDTHLLKLPTNSPEQIGPQDYLTLSDEENSDDGEEEEVDEVGVEYDDDEAEDLAKALQASLTERPQMPLVNDQDDELAGAIAASLDQNQTSEQPSEDVMHGDIEDDDDDDLARAIAMSLENQ